VRNWSLTSHLVQTPALPIAFVAKLFREASGIEVGATGTVVVIKRSKANLGRLNSSRAGKRPMVAYSSTTASKL